VHGTSRKGWCVLASFVIYVEAWEEHVEDQGRRNILRSTQPLRSMLSVAIVIVVMPTNGLQQRPHSRQPIRETATIRSAAIVCLAVLPS
jgi:hypothetical protein